MQKNKPFVQVLHDGKLHWKPISTYGCNEGEVCYIDSLFKGRIADHMKQQICAILDCDFKHQVKIKVLPVQQQSNGVDFGVFVLAFCFHILSEKTNLVGIFFDESKFRHHLLHCFTANLISPFPKSNGQGMKFKSCKDREIMVEIFCTCRMSWRKAENNIYAKQMVECSKCGEWFHRMCEWIPEDIFKKQKIEWLCRSCSNYLIISFTNLNIVSQWEEQQKNIEIDRIFFFCITIEGSKCRNLQVCTQFIPVLILCMCILQLLWKLNLWNGFICNIFI